MGHDNTEPNMSTSTGSTPTSPESSRLSIDSAANPIVWVNPVPMECGMISQGAERAAGPRFTISVSLHYLKREVCRWFESSKKHACASIIFFFHTVEWIIK